MKRGQTGILIVIFISFVLILLGSIFNVFTMSGHVSKCTGNAPLTDIFRCPEGYSIVPKYNLNGCVYSYQCAVLDCPEVEIPNCGARQAPVPKFWLSNNNYCVYEYECVEEPSCNEVLKPNWNCALMPIYDTKGCVKSYQCNGN